MFLFCFHGNRLNHLWTLVCVLESLLSFFCKCKLLNWSGTPSIKDNMIRHFVHVSTESVPWLSTDGTVYQLKPYQTWWKSYRLNMTSLIKEKNIFLWESDRSRLVLTLSILNKKYHDFTFKKCTTHTQYIIYWRSYI